MFATVTFINDECGEYGGIEFPPSPSRFVQAIVAGTSGDERYLPLLRHLETVAPAIYAASKFSEYGYETYVPKNSWDAQRGQTFEQRNASRRKRVNVRLFSAPGIHVVYEYSIPFELIATFREAVGQVSILGKAMDMVITSVSDTLPSGDFDVFIPDAVNARGPQIRLDTPVPGFIDSVFQRYRGQLKRLMVESKPYTKNPAHELSRALFTLTHPVSMEYTSHVVAWVRHAAKVVRKDVAGAISGHGTERLMIVPVPTLNCHDRKIRRVIVTGENGKLVRAAESALAGLSLRDNEGRDMGYLMPAEHDVVFANFLHPGRRWVTTTPVLVSGYDDHDARKRRRLINKMFVHAGLPEPASIIELKGNASSYFVGAKHGYDKLNRIFCAVEFANDVSGIIAAGTGRYVGLGIFANLGGSVAAQ